MPLRWWWALQAGRVLAGDAVHTSTTCISVTPARCISVRTLHRLTTTPAARTSTTMRRTTGCGVSPFRLFSRHSFSGHQLGRYRATTYRDLRISPPYPLPTWNRAGTTCLRMPVSSTTLPASDLCSPAAALPHFSLTSLHYALSLPLQRVSAGTRIRRLDGVLPGFSLFIISHLVSLNKLYRITPPRNWITTTSPGPLLVAPRRLAFLL